MTTSARRISTLGTCLSIIALSVTVLCTDSIAFALRSTPPGGRLVMNLDVLPTAPFQTIGYGHQSWNSLAEQALARWNTAGIGIGQDHSFFSRRVPTVTGDPCTLDGVNEVRAASTLCGMSWGSTVAVTITRSIGGIAVETDVLFNSLLPYD